MYLKRPSRWNLHPVLALIALCVVASLLSTKLQADDKLPPWTPLTKSIRLEKFDKAKDLITPETVKQPDLGGYHPLSYAAYTANIELMEALLKAGADPNVVEPNGKTALYITANMANIKGLELLHRFKATLPPTDALSPAVAAIHSSSLDSLKALIRLYPDVDLNRGWEDRIDGWKLVDSAGGPVAYAAHQGYDEMARFLMSQGASAKGRDYLGHRALHHVAINPNCSVELVRMLVEAGCSPVMQSFWTGRSGQIEGVIPRTPIDYAAVSGNFEKLQVIANSMDPAKHREDILHAAQLAAACRNEKATQYLFGLLSERMPTYREFLELSEKLPQLIEPKPTTSATLSSSEIEKIMPRIAMRPGVEPPSGSVAIISDPDLRDGASLLAAELALVEDIQMVERDQSDLVAAERSLTSLTDGDTALLHRSLNLIPAEHVVILSRRALEDKDFIRLSVINTRSGLITATHAITIKVYNSEEGAKDISETVITSMTGGADRSIAISTTMVAPGSLDYETGVLARDINTILPHLVGNTKGLSLLSRDQLQYLQREKAIGVTGSYWAAGWVIDGGVSTIKDGKSELSLRAIHAISNEEVIARYPVDEAKIDEGLRTCWKDLITRIEAESDAHSLAVPGKDALEKEAEVLQRHAHWLFEGKYYTDAAKLVEASLNLGEKNQDRISLALKIQLKLHYKLIQSDYVLKDRYFNYDWFVVPKLVNYGQWGKHAKAYHNEPRCVSHDFRLRLLDSINDIIHLGELAEASIRHNPRHERAYGWTSMKEYDKDMDPTLYPFISSALSYLLYYSSALDHSMILADSDLSTDHQIIKEQIKRITDQYVSQLEKLNKDFPGTKATTLKLNTAYYLLSRDGNYYARYEPETFERLVTILTRQIQDTEFKLTYLPSISRLSACKVLDTRQDSLFDASKLWSFLRSACFKKATRFDVPLVNTSPVYDYNNREQRVAWLESMSSPPVRQKKAGDDLSTIDEHPIGNLTGMDLRDRNRIESAVVVSSLLAYMDELGGTAERLRLSPLYQTIDGILERDDGALAFLKDRPELNIGKNNSQVDVPEWSSKAWTLVRQAILKKKKPTPDVESLFAELIGNLENEPQATTIVVLQESDMLVMPEQQGHPHRIFHAIYERATVAGDLLWLPGFYSKERMAYKNYKNASEVDADNAIQVVSLKDKSVRTIILPEPEIIENDAFGQKTYVVELCGRRRSDLGRIHVAGDFAYFTPNGRRLFCIHLKDLQVSEVIMPDGFSRLSIRLDSIHQGKGILVVVAQEWKRSRDSLHEVLLVEEGRVSKTLVSNRRKPSESPMDRPDIKPGKFEFRGNTLWLGAQKNLGYSYNLENENWAELKTSDVYRMKSPSAHDYDYTIELSNQLSAHFLESRVGIRMGIWKAHSGSRTQLSLPPKDIFAEHEIGDIRVEVPRINHASFSRKWFPMLPTDANSKEPVFASPNDAILNNSYRVVLMGKWDNSYLLGIKLLNMDAEGKNLQVGLREEYGLDALWMVPEEIFAVAQKPLVKRNARMVDFTAAPKPKDFRHFAAIDYKGLNRGKNWKYNRMELYGEGSVFAIKPALEVADMQLVINLSRAIKNEPLDFRIESGDPENPILLFDGKQHGFGSTKNYPHSATLYVPLPDGVQHIRLINDSPKDHYIKIYKFLFMPKNEG